MRLTQNRCERESQSSGSPGWILANSNIVHLGDLRVGIGRESGRRVVRPERVVVQGVRVPVGRRRDAATRSRRRTPKCPDEFDGITRRKLRSRRRWLRGRCGRPERRLNQRSDLTCIWPGFRIGTTNLWRQRRQDSRVRLGLYTRVHDRQARTVPPERRSAATVSRRSGA